MHKIVKNTLLQYVPTNFPIEKEANPLRVYRVNKPVKKKKMGNIIYLCEREIRVNDNFAFRFAIQKSRELNLPFKIIHPENSYDYLPKSEFINNQIRLVQKTFKKLNINFQIINKTAFEILKQENISVLIIDFNPILKRDYLNKFDFEIFEIDGHNIVPARFVSNKQEYNASTLRRKIYLNIYPFLTEFDNISLPDSEADCVLKNFINNKLPYYAKLKNNPEKDISSGLSKYLNLGFISAQRVALEVLKSDVEDDNKEAFFEELIIRKELADNFCLYTKNFKNFSGIPAWAKVSLEKHRNDLRTYLYSKEELEFAKTHDRLWGAAQTQLIKEGTIHSYLRMYWAKKLLEWCKYPEEALKIAIYLNDKYAYDSPSAIGYNSILWSLGGLHDRAFVDYPVTGKIRRMTYNSIRKKYDTDKYINRYLPN